MSLLFGRAKSDTTDDGKNVFEKKEFEENKDFGKRKFDCVCLIEFT